MVCPVNNEATLTMLVVQPRNRRDGFFLVLVRMTSPQVRSTMALPRWESNPDRSWR